MRGTASSGGNNDAAHLASKIVGFTCAAVFTPPIWRVAAPVVGNFVANTWQSSLGFAFGDLATAAVVFVGLYAVVRSATFFLIMAVMALIARFVVFAAA